MNGSMNVCLAARRIFAGSSLFLLMATFAGAQPPEPPPGKVWVLNSAMSDEFDAGSPGEKWWVYDKENSWNRTAAFDKRVPEPQLIKENGKENYVLAMNPMWYEPEDVFTKRGRTYLFAGGGMATHAMQTFGYFEVRIKPSDFPMGSGVFMNSRQHTDAPCGEKYMTELDIIENMGYTGPGAGDWNNVMHVNTHVKPTDENCRGTAYLSTGGNLGKPLENPLDFNVVGAWWKDDKSADYYLNGEYFQTIEFIKPFVLPMPVILTMETYTWGGDDENNARNPKPLEYMFHDDFRPRELRAVYYDWVRSWILVDIDQEQFNPQKDNVGFYDDPEAGDQGEFTIIYSAKEARKIKVSLFGKGSEPVAVEILTAGAGIGSVNSGLIPGLKTEKGEYKVVCELGTGDAEGLKVLASSQKTIVFEK